MGKKFELASYDVVADTNALYSPDFQSTWESCCGLTTLSLLIPEIVKQERIYQLCTKAKEAAATAAKSLSTLNGLCGFPLPKLPTERKVQATAIKAFERRLARLGTIVLSINYDRLDWKDLIKHSVWRIPPFSPCGEKGFRDYLVLQSLKEIYSARKHDKLTFLCNDKLLKETAAKRFPREDFIANDNLSIFESKLKLDATELDQRYIQNLLKAAPEVFYAKENPDCVYRSCDVFHEIRRTHGDDLDKYPWFAQQMYFARHTQETGTPPCSGLESGDMLNVPYSPKGEDNLVCGDTLFDSVGEDVTMHWKASIKLIRLFEHVRPRTFDLLSTMVRIAPFEIHWSCKVDRDLHCSQLKLSNIIPLLNSVEPYFTSNMTINENLQFAS